ncbi:COG3014 family protein [Sulfurospirillum barnesii]|uniref:Lipoprotein n=1 Tax=Sulfurospirillum barnesii (strain ATCC 700032 / DSM 10660 / SES-3) TaxID=760154 RepID=I3XUJ9_SULBS|nr:hypothetical protein [Sulfurospirillum barnesii]AFL67623.1 hypothetical protein Sulba_0297 [Sulfurospirillum barnesii SES-3]
MNRSWALSVSSVIAFFFLTGCVPAVSTQQLQTGAEHKETVAQTIQAMEKDTSAQSEMWYWLNLARLYQSTKEYEKSTQAFQKAEAILDEYEARAEVSMRNVGSSMGSLLFSKGAETYYGKGYERTLMHTLNGLNYAMMGNFEGATVEMRKMEKRQEFWLKESEEKITEAQQKKKDVQGNPNTEQIPAGYSMGEMLQDPDVKAMANNYQDAFSYALSAVVSRISNDMQYSQISQKRALALSPEASIVFAPFKASPDTVEVYVVAFTGQAPVQSIDKIRFPLPSLNYYTVLDLPALKHPKDDISYVNIYSPLMGESAAPRLLKTDKMAYKTLKDELPLEIMKSVVRATSKGVVAKQASDQGGLLGGLAASILMDVTSSVMEKSYRNWEMLPNSGYLSKVSAKKGDTVVVKLGGQDIRVYVPQETKHGTLILVSYLSSQNVEVDHVEF